jgi:hypothetical protein
VSARVRASSVPTRASKPGGVKYASSRRGDNDVLGHA